MTNRTAVPPALAANSRRIEVPRLHAYQREIAVHPARFKVCASGRRFGKTVLARYLIAREAGRGRPVAYLAPTYKMMGETWRELRNTLMSVATKVSEQDHRMDLIGGGTFECWSLDNESIRGRKYAGLIVDEAGMVGNLKQIWNAALRPTLTDYKGWAMFISTPRGHNGFWELFNMGLDPLRKEWASFSYPTTNNPHIAASEVEMARQDMPEILFAQEYLAEFRDDAGGIFRHVDAVTVAPRNAVPVPGRHYVAGVDLGRHNDFTVISIIDASSGVQVSLERFTEIDWALQRGRIAEAWRYWNLQSIWVESNSFGEPNIEAMQADGLPVYSFTTTGSSKPIIIDGLALAMERTKNGQPGGLTLLDDVVLRNELKAYEMTRLPSGHYRYSAPSGGHDDTVMATAINWYGITGGNPRPAWGTTVV